MMFGLLCWFPLFAVRDACKPIPIDYDDDSATDLDPKSTKGDDMQNAD